MERVAVWRGFMARLFLEQAEQVAAAETVEPVTHTSRSQELHENSYYCWSNLEETS